MDAYLSGSCFTGIKNKTLEQRSISSRRNAAQCGSDTVLVRIDSHGERASCPTRTLCLMLLSHNYRFRFIGSANTVQSYRDSFFFRGAHARTAGAIGVSCLHLAGIRATVLEHGYLQDTLSQIDFESELRR